MNSSTVFTLHFSRLLAELVHDPANANAHRLAVDDLLEATQDAVTLIWDDWKLVVDGAVVPPTMPGVQDVVSRMAAHGLRSIAFGRAAEPGHVLGAVWILARQPVLGDGGAAAIERLARLGVSRVEFVPVSAPEAAAVGGAVAEAGAPPPLLDHFELKELGVVVPTPLQAATLATAVAPRPAPAPASPDDGPESLLDQLREARSVDALLPPLNALVTIIRTAVAARKISEAAVIVAEMVNVERVSPVDGARRSFTMALRSIADSAFIGALAADLPRSREQRARYMTIFARCGDEAVDVLLDQLAYAELAKDRRVLFDAIAELGRGVPTLIRMLSDDRWYVVRNAAELLGRISAMAAEEPLSKALRHKEARVRRSAALALAKLGTPGAIAALRDAIGDPKPDVRLHAILAVADRREPGIVAAVVRALDAEKDPEVQAAILAVLGKIGTAVAVRRLIAAAADDGKLFRRRPTPMRVAAVRALAEAQTPEAVAAIQSLITDRDREVRDSAAKGLAAQQGDGAGAPEPSDW